MLPEHEITRNLKILSTIQTGVHANIYRVQDTVDNKLYALKVVVKTFPELYEEGIILTLLNHKNIIHLHKYAENDLHRLFLMELGEEDLFYSIYRGCGFPERKATQYLKSITTALKYCYDTYGMMHRDIKPENIVVMHDGTLKLVDFGHATLDKSSNDLCGTTSYLSPEMIKKTPHTYKVDIWSLGILFYEMLFANTPFAQKTNVLTAEAILYKKVAFKTVPSLHSSTVKLIRGMLEKNPEKRLDYDQVLEKIEKILATSYVF